MAEAKNREIYGAVDETELLRLARQRFHEVVDFERENREAMLDDLEFKTGKQWTETDRQEREEDGRPVITINMMKQFVRQVTGDARINRPSIKVRPVDDGSDKDVAEIFTGVIRHIENASQARIAYTTAIDSAASGGAGAFRLVTEYASDDVFDQDIRIRRIPNPFSVYFDHASIDLVKRDARFCFVTERVAKEEFEARYPDAAMTEFDASTIEGLEFLADWIEDEALRVAEYWIKVPFEKTVYQLDDGTVTDELPKGQKAKRERKCQSHKIYQYIISGAEILEGPTEWPGKHIPIIFVPGEETYVGERVVRSGLIRDAKDPQRLVNYWRTAAAEHIALQPKAPFMATVKNVAGQETNWAKANRSNLPYLLYRPDPDNGGIAPQRQQPPAMSTALTNEAATAVGDLYGTIGIYPPSLGQKSNETSGKAINARQQESDVGTFVYIDNLSHAMQFAGEQLVDLIPKIYDGERVIRILGEDDTEDFVKLNVAVPNPATNETVYMIEMRDEKGHLLYKPALDAGKYDVTVTTGPSYSTKRLEASDSLMQFLQSFPAAGPVIGDLIAKNMDWPGADKIAERLKKMLPPGMDEDAAPPPPPEPDPKVLIDTMKAKSAADKTNAEIEKMGEETRGVALANAQKELELSQMMGAIPAMVQEAVQMAVIQVLSGQPPQMQPQPAQMSQPPQGGFSMPNGSQDGMTGAPI